MDRCDLAEPTETGSARLELQSRHILSIKFYMLARRVGRE
jgi:hypothetical protein